MCGFFTLPVPERSHHGLASLEKSAGAIREHSRAYLCIDFRSDRNLRLYVVAPLVIFSKNELRNFRSVWRLGKEGQEHIKNELDSLKQKVSLQETIINDLRSTGGVPRTQVELLNSANATVVSALADLEQANTNLGETLSLAGTARLDLPALSPIGKNS